MNTKNIIICGLPSSGKTTFLAALWYLLSMDEKQTTLSLRSLPDSRDYLNTLSKQWASFNEFGRTPIEEFQEISLQLKYRNTDIDLSIPDMSGEKWQAIWGNRTLSKTAYDWTDGDTSIMLFIHVDNYNRPLDILMHNEMLAFTGEEPVDGEFIEYKPENSPTQVILVDILQAISTPPIGKKGRKLAIILSAWDKAEDTRKSPEEFLCTEFPFLNQFLNFGGFFSETKIFGVSAQGGDLKLHEDAERLKAIKIPSERIKVILDNELSHDLTIPIKWLIES